MPLSPEQLVYLLAFACFIVILIYWSGWFSGIETALTHLTPVQLAAMQHHKEKNIDYILKLKRNMNRTLVAILIGNNVVNIVLSAVTALAANAIFQEIGVSVAIGIITFVIIIFGEITPKSNALSHSKIVAQKKARTLYYLSKILSPLISIFIYLSGLILKATGIKRPSYKLLVTDEDIKELVSLGEREGLIKPLEKDIIYKVFHFGDRTVDDIMVPIEKVFALDEHISIKTAIKKFRQHSFTRLPVINQNGQIVGILNMKDLIGKRAGTITPLIRRPLLVSGRHHISTLFLQMQKKHIHMAVVRDLRHKHLGIITMEDILEELVGEIYDEYFHAKYGKKQ